LALLAATFADRIERKWIICGASLAICIFGIAFSELTQPVPLIVCVLVTAANMTLSYAYHAYRTEVFPTAIRARACGLVHSMSRLSAMLSGFIIAYTLRHGGVSGVFSLITSAMIIVIAAFGPNVLGQALDTEQRSARIERSVCALAEFA
jgi:MFS transporter, putative metabolite:H+ symporter